MFRINLRPGVLLPFLRLIVANVSQQVRFLDWDYQTKFISNGLDSNKNEKPGPSCSKLGWDNLTVNAKFEFD